MRCSWTSASFWLYLNWKRLNLVLFYFFRKIWSPDPEQVKGDFWETETTGEELEMEPGLFPSAGEQSCSPSGHGSPGVQTENRPDQFTYATNHASSYKIQGTCHRSITCATPSSVSGGSPPMSDAYHPTVTAGWASFDWEPGSANKSALRTSSRKCNTKWSPVWIFST